MATLTDKDIAEIRARHLNNETIDFAGKELSEGTWEHQMHIDRAKLLAHITEQSAQIARMDEALLREKAERNVERIRGSNDAPGYEACVKAEMEDLRRAASAREK